MQASIVGENAIDTPVGSYHRCLVINSPCDSPSNAKNQRSSPPPLIRVDDSIGGVECHGLNWWISNLETTNGRPIHLGVPEMMIESDASNTG